MSDVFSHLRRILWKPTKIKPKVEETQNFPLWHLGELLTKINTIFIGEPDIFDLFGTTWFLSHGAFNLKKKTKGTISSAQHKNNLSTIHILCLKYLFIQMKKITWGFLTYRGTSFKDNQCQFLQTALVQFDFQIGVYGIWIREG